MKYILMNYVYNIFYVLIPSFFNCKRAGLSFKKTWKIVGKPVIIKRHWYERLFKNIMVVCWKSEIHLHVTDTDSHPLTYEYRLVNDMSKTNASPIIIKEGAFIGARSIIMKGVTIGEHVVIGAGSVVTKSIPDNVIACGNPAKVVKSLVP